ncbi:MAG: carbohydrate porin [Phycisphaerales bacterium]|nr:carbohydrate porin [Phycisphaerales bacterium]
MSRQGTLIGFAAIATLTSSAMAQQFAEVMEFGPQELPGHERRATPRPEREEAPAVEAGPAELLGWWERERITGDWVGARPMLEDSGLTIDCAYIGEWMGVLDGGVRRKGSVRGLLDVNATLDLDAAFGWEGAQVFADFYWIDGNSLSADAGDFQGVSNIEADNRTQLSELWFEQVLFEGQLRIKVGKIEGNAEFGFVEAAGDFLNSSAGFSPTIVAMTTYPDPATGVVVSWNATDRVSITGGVFDGAGAVDGVTTGDLGPATFFSDDQSDDYAWMGEVNVGWDGGRAGVGVWHHTGDFARFDGSGDESGTTGFYALGEHRVWSADDEDERGVDVFGQFGWADEDVSEVSWHLAAGAAWMGPFDSRPDDATGVYVSRAALSGPAGFDDDETTIELFYKVQLTPAVSVKPDLQFVFNPGGDSTVDDAVVGGVRVEIAF